jgi:transketolase
MRSKLMDLISTHAAADPSILFLTGDLGFSFVEPLQASLGDRFINAGVAEANMITMAGALAACGFRPYAYTIAPFITTRCYEQIRNDICFPCRTVNVIGVGAGLSYGSLGPTHHSLEDVAIMATLPSLAVAAPANEAELQLVHGLFKDSKHPVYFRVPRESGTPYPVPAIANAADAAFLVEDGDDVALVANGPSVNECLVAARRLAEAGVSAAVISVPILSPFPAKAVEQAIGSRPIVTVFEGYSGGPLEFGILRLLASGAGMRPIAHVAVDLRIPTKCGSTEFLREQLGIDANAIVRTAGALLGISAASVVSSNSG